MLTESEMREKLTDLMVTLDIQQQRASNERHEILGLDNKLEGDRAVEYHVAYTKETVLRYVLARLEGIVS